MARILLNKDNLFYNLEAISQKATSKEKVAVVLKDNAYGHGIVEIAKLSCEFGIKKAVVRSVEDAQKIKDYFSTPASWPAYFASAPQQPDCGRDYCRRRRRGGVPAADSDSILLYSGSGRVGLPAARGFPAGQADV